MVVCSRARIVLACAGTCQSQTATQTMLSQTFGSECQPRWDAHMHTHTHTLSLPLSITLLCLWVSVTQSSRILFATTFASHHSLPLLHPPAFRPLEPRSQKTDDEDDDDDYDDADLSIQQRGQEFVSPKNKETKREHVCVCVCVWVCGGAIPFAVTPPLLSLSESALLVPIARTHIHRWPD